MSKMHFKKENYKWGLKLTTTNNKIKINWKNFDKKFNNFAYCHLSESFCCQMMPKVKNTIKNNLNKKTKYFF